MVERLLQHLPGSYDTPLHAIPRASSQKALLHMETGLVVRLSG